MANARDVVVDILGRDKTSAAAKSAAGNFGKVAKASKGLKDEFQKGAIAVAAVTGAVVGLNKVMQAGLTMGLIRANAQVALGATGYAQLSKAAESSAHSLGLTTSEFINSAGQAAILAKNMGFGQATAVQFGALLPDLANRLSIMSSGQRDAAQSSDMLRSALAGEYDPLQAVGINISAAIVATKALGIQQRSGNKLTIQQANSLAVLSIVQDQTAQTTQVMATAQGKAYLAAQQNTAALKEQWQTLQQQLTPAISDALAVTTEWFDVLLHPEKLKRLDQATKEYKDSVDNAGKATTGMTYSVDEMAQTASGSARDVYAYARSLDYAREAADKSANAQLADRDAARGFAQALADAKGELKDNGRTLDINTQKGRDNAASLDKIAAAANKQAQAILTAGGSQAQFDRSLSTSRAQLEAMAVRFGMSRNAAARYAREVLAIPKTVTSNVTLNVNTKVNQAKVSLGTYDRLLQLKPGGAFAADLWFAPVTTPGQARTQPAAPVHVENRVMLDGVPFAAMTATAVDAGLARQAYRARVGRR